MLPAETSNIAQLVDTQRIVDLPLNGRQAQSLLFLAPGTTNTTLYYCGSSCQGGVSPNAQCGHISGGGPGNITYQLDGGDHNDHYINSNYPFPNPDAIQEFSVQTNNLSADMERLRAVGTFPKFRPPRISGKRETNSSIPSCRSANVGHSQNA